MNMGNTNKAGIFDLEKLFTFYGAYHSNPTNVLIHIFLVWPIFFTFLLVFYFTPSLYDFSESGILPHGLDCALVLNFGFFITLVHVVFYIGLDKRAGSLGAFLCILSWIGVSYLGTYLGLALSLKVALSVQVLCWIGQAVGHGIFEKRAPAFQTRFYEAAITAPFFGLLEVLHMFFGYEPYPGFLETIKVKVDAEIKEWKESKLKKVT